MRNIRNLVLTGVSAIALATPAFAQTEVVEEAATDEIIVTGTLIRGVEPTGTAVIGVDRQAIQATGATTVTQLLQNVPQFGSFNSLQTPVGGGNTVTTNRPNLRALPASNLNGAASTLVLIDGHRVVGAGIQQTSPDLDSIAPGAIERVDVVTDGGSSIYGADAVGGVVNFITRKTYDGVGVDGRFGFADDYKTWDANVIVGKTWNDGGIYVTYNYSQHDALLGGDRDWVHQFPTLTSAVAVPVTGIECRQPNVQVNGTAPIYGLPFSPSVAAKRNQPNQCDYSDLASVYPTERRHAVFASLTQDLSDSLTFEVKSFFMDRKQTALNGYFHTSKVIGSGGGNQFNSPYRSQYIIDSPTEAQKVSFAWGPDDASHTDIHLQAWGVTPSFAAKFGSNWQARLLFNYGESTTTVHQAAFNDAALGAAITAGMFNPYNPADTATNNASALGVIGNWETFGQAKQSQLQARAIVDGELFELPGGMVKVAVGAEYLRETLRTQKGNVVPGAQDTGFGIQSVNGTQLLAATPGLPIARSARNVKSAFGEIVMPLLADVGGFQELTFSASGRYDSYNDAGDTFNPKFGLTWKPVDYLRIRGQWGKSFSAPSLANRANHDPSTATFSTGAVFAFLVTPGVGVLNSLGYPSPTAGNSTILTLGGGSNDLQPQKAQTWSVGFDLDPIDGARLSLTYWNVKYDNIIGQPAFFNPAVYFAQYPGSYVIVSDPALSAADRTALVQDLLADATNINQAPCSPMPTCVDPSTIYVIERNTTQNLGRFRQAGFDFAASYRTNTGFGSIDLSSAGTYILRRSQSVSAVADLVDQIPNGVSKFNLRTTAGANIGNLRGQVTWNHTAGYDFVPANAGLAGFFPAQGRIGAFNTVDLFFMYDFDGEGAMKDLALTLGVNNVLDASPPVRYVGGATASSYGYANGTTLGRLIQVGFNKKF